MANQFIQLPASAADDAGVAVDTSGLAAKKTIVVAGSWRLTPNITIEFNNDPAQDGPWSALGTVQGGGFLAVDVVCMWMRARVSNFKGGQAPQVWVGAPSDSPMFVELVAPAGNGIGTAVDVAGYGIFKTVQVGGTFRGSTIIEISNDGGATWAQPASFDGAGMVNLLLTADFMRVKRVGVPTIAPGLPIINVGAASSVDGGGGGGNAQRFFYVATGAEGATFPITLPVARQDTSYMARVTGAGLTALLLFDCPEVNYGLTGFVCVASDSLHAGDVLAVTVEDLA